MHSCLNTETCLADVIAKFMSTGSKCTEQGISAEDYRPHQNTKDLTWSKCVGD